MLPVFGIADDHVASLALKGHADHRTVNDVIRHFGSQLGFNMQTTGCRPILSLPATVRAPSGAGARGSQRRATPSQPPRNKFCAPPVEQTPASASGGRMPRAALLETMEEVKRQLGITDPVLYSAVKAANGMMGLAADGTLPQQVHKLAAALGLSRHTVQAQQARDEAPYRHARCVAAPRPPDRCRTGRPASTDTVYAAAVAALTLPKPSPPPLPPPPCPRPPPHRLRLQQRRGKSHQLRLRRSTCRPRQQSTRRAPAECHSRMRRPTRAPRCQRPAPRHWTTGPRAASDIHGRRAATIRTRPGGGSRRSRTWASGGSPRRDRRAGASMRPSSPALPPAPCHWRRGCHCRRA